MGFLNFARLREAGAESSSAALLRGRQDDVMREDDLTDVASARDALARVAANGTPDEQKQVRAAVYAKYPQLKESTDELRALVQTLEGALADQRVSKIRETARDEMNRMLREAAPSELASTLAAVTPGTTSEGQQGYEVVLIKEGLGNHDDDTWYTREAIQAMCESGVCEGMRAFSNHPPLDEEETLPERDVEKIVGFYHDVKFAESDGKASAKGIFVPIEGPGYEWVTTLAEAAVNNHAGDTPLVGISLYGLSAGDEGARPDGSYGRMAERVWPTSADIVTNAGAGGEFVRRLMESARAARALRETNKETKAMTFKEYQEQLAQRSKRVREAGTDEERTTALSELDKLAEETVDAPEPQAAPAVAELSVEKLAEAAPDLVKRIRESATADAAKDSEQTKTQLREATKALGDLNQVLDAMTVLREAEVDKEDVDYYVSEIRSRGVRDKDGMKAMVESLRDREQRLVDRATAAYGVEGNPSRQPTAAGNADDVLREAGVPLKEPAAA